MKTLVTAIQKGGQGKTCLTCHLAWYFQELGKRVAVVDLDSQGNASWTLSDFATPYTAAGLFSDPDRNRTIETKPHDISLFTSDAELANLDANRLTADPAGALKRALAGISNKYDVCLIDTPPSLGVSMTAAVLAADYLLSPIELEAYSLQGLKKMLTVIRNLRSQNRRLTFLGMAPNKVDARKPRHVASLTQLRDAYPNLVLPMSIGARDSIAQALADRAPVWKSQKTAARKGAQEVRALAQHVFDKMELN